MDHFTPERLVAEAIAATGYSDFGGDDLLDRLERNARSFSQIPLTEPARALVRAKLLADLSNRLRIEAWNKAHPQCARERIEGPLLVCGLPRTGTTATVAMLALDP